MLTRRRLLSLAAVPAVVALAPAAEDSHLPVTDTGFVSIGAIEQWVAIRGNDRSHPAILFLHGGPGDAQSPFLSLFAPWEQRYVVTQWDQRGAGRTFGKNGTSTPNMTLAQIAQDTVEVTEYVLSRLGLRKLILVGHSWGSIVGLKAIRVRPKLFHAFVGTGQVASGKRLFEMWRLSALARARAAGDSEAARTLNGASAADFTDMTKLGILFKWQPPFSRSDKSYIARQDSTLAASPESAEWVAGKMSFSIPRLVRDFIDFEPGAAPYDVPVPFFVIQGRYDSRTPPEAAHAFVNQVRAPAKGYSAIDGGHFACFTNPTDFLDALDNHIRGLGISA